MVYIIFMRSDFGLSRLFGEEQTRTCTSNRNGTLGYMAPEYRDKGIITKKVRHIQLGGDNHRNNDGAQGLPS